MPVKAARLGCSTETQHIPIPEHDGPQFLKQRITVPREAIKSLEGVNKLIAVALVFVGDILIEDEVEGNENRH